MKWEDCQTESEADFHAQAPALTRGKKMKGIQYTPSKVYWGPQQMSVNNIGRVYVISVYIVYVIIYMIYVMCYILYVICYIFHVISYMLYVI